MPHIHTNPGEHDHTASAYVFRVDGPEPLLYLHRHRKLGRWMQFGGHIEPRQQPWQAMQEELLHESGFVLDQLRVLQPPVARILKLTEAVVHPIPVAETTYPFKDPRIKDHNHIDHGYALVTKEEPRQAIATGESTDIRLFSRDELMSLSPDTDTFRNVQEIAGFIFDNCLDSWEAVSASSFST